MKLISVGDKVIISSRHHHKSIDTVKRLTKTQIILAISNSKFDRNSGNLIGGSVYGSSSIAIASEELIKQVRSEQYKRKLFYYLKCLNWKNVSIKHLEKITLILKGD